MKVLTKEELLARLAEKSLPTKTIDVPELGGAVVIRPLSKKAQMDIRRQTVGQDGEAFNNDLYEQLLLVECVIEPKLTLAEALHLFSAGLTARAVENILQEINDLSGITARGETSQEAATAAEQEFRQES